jgi:hypothetical protein
MDVSAAATAERQSTAPAVNIPTVNIPVVTIIGDFIAVSFGKITLPVS